MSAMHPDTSSPSAGYAGLLLSATSFLERERPWYSGRARRKKIVLASFEARNVSGDAIVFDVSRAALLAGGQRFETLKREAVFSKLSTFQWDFLFYWILHLSLIEFGIELAVFFAGAWFNKSLRKQLGAIREGRFQLAPGQRLDGLIAFRGARKLDRAELEIPWSTEGARENRARCPIS